MLDAEKLAAFVFVTGMTSLVPGVSMLFVMTQSIQHGARSGAAALAGLQLGYIVWWLLAALGLGALAAAFPLAFGLLASAGALFLAWLGLKAILAARHPADRPPAPAPKPSRHALRDGIFVALGNPKSLIYVVALLPPFVDVAQPIGPQLLFLAAVAMAIDIALGALYILAGAKLAAAMARPTTRAWLDRTIGALFIAIALAILADQLLA
jgi:threonine/homoserine/homoserine lactone efflux protein